MVENNDCITSSNQKTDIMVQQTHRYAMLSNVTMIWVHSSPDVNLQVGWDERKGLSKVTL